MLGASAGASCQTSRDVAWTESCDMKCAQAAGWTMGGGGLSIMMLDTKGASEALTKKFICHMTSAQKATCGDAASGFWGRREEEGKKKRWEGEASRRHHAGGVLVSLRWVLVAFQGASKKCAHARLPRFDEGEAWGMAADVVRNAMSVLHSRSTIVLLRPKCSHTHGVRVACHSKPDGVLWESYW